MQCLLGDRYMSRSVALLCLVALCLAANATSANSVPSADSSTTSSKVPFSTSSVAASATTSDEPNSNDTRPQRKRQTDPTIIQLNTDIGLSGYTMTLNPIDLAMPNLSLASWQNRISSLRMYNLSYVCQLFTGNNYSGTSWGFRHEFSVLNLTPYGLNDVANSVKCTYVGWQLGPGAVLYQDYMGTGKSVYLPGGNYPSMTTAVSPWGGSIANDALTSMNIYPGTQVQLFANDNYNTILGTWTNPAAGEADYVVDLYNTASNDMTSSIKITQVADL